MTSLSSLFVGLAMGTAIGLVAGVIFAFHFADKVIQELERHRKRGPQ